MKETAYCKKCNFEEEYEPDIFGLNYYQAVGTCQNCDEPTYIKGTDKPTAVVIIIKPVHKNIRDTGQNKFINE